MIRRESSRRTLVTAERAVMGHNVSHETLDNMLDSVQSEAPPHVICAFRKVEKPFFMKFEGYDQVCKAELIARARARAHVRSLLLARSRLIANNVRVCARAGPGRRAACKLSRVRQHNGSRSRRGRAAARS